MFFELAAGAVLLLHLAFILFALLGALFAARRRWALLIQLPAATWGVYAELTGRICPLTILENFLRVRAGQSGYAQSFLDHYLAAIIYPDGLTRGIQYTLAAIVVAINVAIYAWLFFPRPRTRGRES
jgi:hypothetical protein